LSSFLSLFFLLLFFFSRFYSWEDDVANLFVVRKLVVQGIQKVYVDAVTFQIYFEQRGVLFEIVQNLFPSCGLTQVNIALVEINRLNVSVRFDCRANSLEALVIYHWVRAQIYSFNFGTR